MLRHIGLWICLWGMPLQGQLVAQHRLVWVDKPLPQPLPSVLLTATATWETGLRAVYMQFPTASTTRLLVHRYDLQGKATSTERYDVQGQPSVDRIYPLFVHSLDDTLVVLSHQTASRQRETMLVLDRFTGTNTPARQPQVLHRTAIPSPGKGGTYWVVQPRNRQRMLLSYLPAAAGTERQRLWLALYDPSGSQLQWQREVELPHPAKSCQLLEIKLTNAGRVAALFQVEAPRNQVADAEPLVQPYVYTWGPTPEQDAELHLTEAGIALAKPHLETDEVGNLYCASLYNRVGTTPYSDGLIYMQIDAATGRVGQKSLVDLPDLYRPEQMLRSYRIPYVVRQVFLKPDGGKTIVAEQYRYRRFSSRRGGRVTRGYQYLYLVVIELNAAGQMTRVHHIPKFQATNATNRYSGYGVVARPDGSLLFLYNDHPRNTTHPDNGRKLAWMRNMRRSTTVALQLSPDGEMQKAPLQDNRSSGRAIVPMLTRPLGDHQLMLMSDKVPGSFFGMFATQDVQLGILTLPH